MYVYVSMCNYYETLHNIMHIPVSEYLLHFTLIQIVASIVEVQ